MDLSNLLLASAPSIVKFRVNFGKFWFFVLPNFCPLLVVEKLMKFPLLCVEVLFYTYRTSFVLAPQISLGSGTVLPNRKWEAGDYEVDKIA